MRGSQLQKKDAFLQNANANANATPLSGLNHGIPRDSTRAGNTSSMSNLRSDEATQDDNRQIAHHTAFTSPIDTKRSTISPTSNNSSATLIGSATSGTPVPSDIKLRSQYSGIDANVGRGWDARETGRGGNMTAVNGGISRAGSFGTPQPSPHYPISPAGHTAPFTRPRLQPVSSSGTQPMQAYSRHSPYSSSGTPVQGYPTPNQSHPIAMDYRQHSGGGMYSNQGFQPVPLSLPPSNFSSASLADSSRPASSSMLQPTYLGAGRMDPSNMDGSMSAAEMSDPYIEYPTMQIFNPGIGNSPYTNPDDFANWLGLGDPSLGPSMGNAGHNTFPPLMEGTQFDLYSSIPYMGQFEPPMVPPKDPMAVTSLVDTSVPKSKLSDEKRLGLLELMDARFVQTDSTGHPMERDALLKGDRNDDHHVLSLKMMQTYVASFWRHFHPQLPLLHKPSFEADNTENLLLIAVMTIGASCLDKGYGQEATAAAADLSQFMARHLRMELFGHPDFNPPGTLWIFQALLLLEIYEKMYSTRYLHERAHLHHGTTITLIRRGSSLVNRSALDSPPSARDEKKGPGSDTSNVKSLSERQEWDHWIINEATRRACFAAFVMDASHATMFGHKAAMVAHEMRLPLPCDESLWSAETPDEVARLEATLQAQGVKPIGFLEGLKKTLSRQPIKTNSFGRTVLMAGLLSVSYQMNERDVQVNSIGVTLQIGGRDRWRTSLTKAFDTWQEDFDGMLPDLDQTSSSYVTSQASQDENVFESRTVLHHLAHMAMHVDIIDCQMFAGAQRLLGRAIRPLDYRAATKRMRDSWAPSARARDATYHAHKFLQQVLIPDEQGQRYIAREDFLLNRPWVLYFAALITWSYGYALEGKITTSLPPLDTEAQRYADMETFLRRVRGVDGPGDLQTIWGRNQCVGLLLVLRDMFQKTRWELLHEAAKLLTRCVDTLTAPS